MERKKPQMKIELTFSITELSSLTGKTRPTLYKYIKAFESDQLDDLPYSFIQLFNLMNKPGVKRKEIVDYCNNNFQSVTDDMKLNEVITLLKENKDRLDLEDIKKMIEEELRK